MTNPIASDTLVEAIARAILNSDRIAGGWPPVESRDDIPDSDGYVRNAQVALTAITEAGYVVCPREPTPEMIEAEKSVDMLSYCEGDPTAYYPDAAAIYRAMINAVTQCNNNGKAE